MEIIFLAAAVVLTGALLFLWYKRIHAPDPREQLAERAFPFFSRFCSLRAEHGVLGTAHLSFREDTKGVLTVSGEMTLLFSGSTVTLRETLGTCRREDIPAIAEALRLRLLAAFPGAEVDVGARRVFIR